jgi:hypothetical protein
MSKTLWHTITIKVPAEMVEMTKTGKVSIKKTLTKTLNVSKSNKKPSIKLVPANVKKNEIVNTGKEWDIDELKKRMTKAKALSLKNKDRDIFESKDPYTNLNKFEGNIAKRAKELGKIKKEKDAAKKEEDAAKKGNPVVRKSNSNNNNEISSIVDEWKYHTISYLLDQTKIGYNMNKVIENLVRKK